MTRVLSSLQNSLKMVITRNITPMTRMAKNTTIKSTAVKLSWSYLTSQKYHSEFYFVTLTFWTNTNGTSLAKFRIVLNETCMKCDMQHNRSATSPRTSWLNNCEVNAPTMPAQFKILYVYAFCRSVSDLMLMFDWFAVVNIKNMYLQNDNN